MKDANRTRTYVLVPLILGVLLITLGCSCRRTPSPQAPPPRSPVSSSATPVDSTPRALYGQVIITPAPTSPQLRGTVDDVAKVLTQSAGVPFSVSASAKSDVDGIHFLRTTDPGVSPEDVKRLALAGPEAFVIRSVDDRRLFITANADAGLSYGAYEYLRELGCRWLLPSDVWTVIPPRRDIKLSINRLIVPAFRSRTFFSTGDFGPATPVDKPAVMRQRWDIWKARNGFGGEFVLGGHAGEAVAVANRATLEAHPEYLALVAGKRSKWSPSVRYCASNPGLVKLWVEDRLGALRRAINVDSKAPWAVSVTVEPADGAGRCECARCRAIGAGTESDQVFYLANHVAKAVAKEFPGHYVNLMAYTQHALPPTIPIEKNVYVTVVPEAFQRTGLSPERLVAAWHASVPRFSIYVHWSIPDWALEMPTFDFLTIPSQRFRSWRSEGADGVSIETTYGGGAMGPGLYVISRLLWNPDEDARALSEEFFRVGFGAAAAPMRRMVERWGAAFTPTAYELGLSYADLAEASMKAANDPPVQRRVRAYEAYLQYLRLWLEYQGASAHTEDRMSRARAALTWLNRTYDTGMIASSRMRDLILNRFDRDPILGSEFGVRNPSGSGWARSAVPLHSAELDDLMQDGARVYPVLPPLDQKPFSSKLVPQTHPPPPSPPDRRELLLAGGIDVEIQVLPGHHLEFEISVRKSASVVADTVTVTGPTGAVVVERRIPADLSMNVVSLPDSPPGQYRCHIEDQKATFVLHVPPNVPMAINQIVSTDISPRLYFWVPAGLRRIGMYAPSAAPVELFDADGQRVAAAGSGMILADVAPGQDGRAWSLSKYKSWTPLRPMNFPWAFAPSPDVLLVPEDAQR